MKLSLGVGIFGFASDVNLPAILSILHFSPLVKKYTIPVGKSTNDSPNIITRLFNTKFTKLLNDIINNEFFGKIWAYV